MVASQEFGWLHVKEADDYGADCLGFGQGYCLHHNWKDAKHQKYLNKLLEYNLIDSRTMNQLIEKGNPAKHFVYLIGKNKKLSFVETSTRHSTILFDNWTKNCSVSDGKNVNLRGRFMLLGFYILFI